MTSEANVIVTSSPMGRHPVVSAVIAAVASTCCLLLADHATLPQLEVASINREEAPRIDGDIADEIWARTRPLTITMNHGGDFGGRGEARVEIRAAHDERNLYLAFVWDDPSRSLQRIPMIKENGQWRLVQTDFDRGAEGRFYDDRFAVMLAASGPALIGGAIHLGIAPLPGKPAPLTGRGFHYSTGSQLDVLLWNAVTNGVTSRVEDLHIGAPLTPSEAQMAGEERYAAGIFSDAETPLTRTNFITPQALVDRSLLTPLMVPSPSFVVPLADLISSEKGHSAGRQEAGYWVLTRSSSQPYSEAADQLIPDGAVIPGVLAENTISLRDGPRGAGQWGGGKWVLEIRRLLRGDDEDDILVKTGTLMWMAAFDHAETRHTYHVRPLELELQ